MFANQNQFESGCATAFAAATAKEQRAYQALDSAFNKVARVSARLYNAILDRITVTPSMESSSLELSEVLTRAKSRSDISDHLPILFQESLNLSPRLIVELGVRGGESTFVFERVAQACGAACLSVDIEDCSAASRDCRCFFVQSDDIAFAGEFRNWCHQKGLSAEIDILFVDTSHFFEHTLLEIKHWFPFLAPRAKVIFHDTNQKRIYFRKDGSVGVGWTNRGVMAALEKYLLKSFNEKKDFVDRANGWLISHHAKCNGLTVLSRDDLSPANL